MSVHISEMFANFTKYKNKSKYVLQKLLRTPTCFKFNLLVKNATVVFSSIILKKK